MSFEEHKVFGTLTDQVATCGRPQPYRLMHKALRALMFHALQQVATLDAAKEADRADLQAVVEELLLVCSDHLDREDRFFLAPLRERAPRAVIPFDHDHDEHAARIAVLRSRLKQVAACGTDARAHAYALYLDLGRFVGSSLEHMVDEETQLTRALWQNFDDAEIREQTTKLHASFSDQESAYYLRWMARALNDYELAELAVSLPSETSPERRTPILNLINSEMDLDRCARFWRSLGNVIA